MTELTYNKLLLFGTIYIVTIICFILEQIKYNNIMKIHDILIIINILSVYQYITNLTSLIQNNNKLDIVNKLKMIVLFCCLHNIIIVSCVYHTVYSILNFSSIDNNFYDSLSIIINCILLSNYLIHSIFNINKCDIFEKNNIEDNVFISKYCNNFRIYIIVYICILNLLNIIYELNNITSNRSIYLVIIMIFFLIITCKNLCIKEIQTFLHIILFTMNITSIVFIFGTVVYNIYLYDDIYYIYAIINIGILLLILVSSLYQYCSNSNNDIIIDNNNIDEQKYIIMIEDNNQPGLLSL